MKETPKIRRQEGFSLTEVLVVVFIILVLASFAGPKVGTWMDNFNLSSDARKIRSALQLARMKAIKERGKTYIVHHGSPWPENLCSSYRSDKSWLVFWDKNDDQKWDSGDEALACGVFNKCTVKKTASTTLFGFNPQGTAVMNGSDHATFCYEIGISSNCSDSDIISSDKYLIRGYGSGVVSLFYNSAETCEESG